MAGPLKAVPLAALVALGISFVPPAAAHTKKTHVYVTKKAYELYVSRYGETELDQFIGAESGNVPTGESQGTVIEGAFDEDMVRMNPWGDLFPQAFHFWDRTKGPYAGIMGNDSAVNRAVKYFTGGYGINGNYDTGWQGGGSMGGKQGKGAISLYRAGEKAKAYWYLGHAAHLLEDLTVPAHSWNFPHVNSSDDAYEEFMGEHCTRWRSLPNIHPLPMFGSLYELFDKTADVSNDYDAGRGEGPELGVDGEVDKGQRRKGGFNEAKLSEEGDALMPLVYERVASLFILFYKEVDANPPNVERPRIDKDWNGRKPQDPRIQLRAKARDSQSGVDRLGYRFEVALWDGSAWSAWTLLGKGPGGDTILFEPESGRRYAFRVSAVDAVGNRAASESVEYPAVDSVLARR